MVWIIVMFISDSHSDGTHSLQGIHWWASDVYATFLQIWWRNKLIYILNSLRVRTFSANFLFYFGVNYSFKSRFYSVCYRGCGRRVRPCKCPGSAGVWSSTAVCFRTLGRGQRAPISPHRTQHSSEHRIAMATLHIYTTDTFTAI